MTFPHSLHCESSTCEIGENFLLPKKNFLLPKVEHPLVHLTLKLSRVLPFWSRKCVAKRHLALTAACAQK